MIEQGILTFEFIQRNPASAARVFENLEPADCAAYLNKMPARRSAPLVSQMIPWSAARCVERMKAEAASGILRAMSQPDSVSILRLVGEDARTRILKASTTRFTRNFRNSLVYPNDAVGAWIDLSTPSFAEDATVRDSIRIVRRMDRSASHLFVVDSDRRFVGIVTMFDLVTKDENAILGDLVDRSIRPLSNRTSLAVATMAKDWEKLNILPVVGRRQNFLGGLSSASMHKGLSEHAVISEELAPGSIIAQIMSAFLIVSSEFANMSLVTSQKISSSRKRNKSHDRKRASRGQRA